MRITLRNIYANGRTVKLPVNDWEIVEKQFNFIMFAYYQKNTETMSSVSNEPSRYQVKLFLYVYHMYVFVE